MISWRNRSKRASLASLVLLIVVVGPVVAHDPDVPPHPVVGAWVVYRGNTYTTDGSNPASGLTIHADGTVRDDGGLHGPGIGAWVATDERSADVTIRYPGVFDGVISALLFRAHVTVHPLEDKFFGEYTVQTPRGDGVELERGPHDLMGYLSYVEPMGPDPTGPVPRAEPEP